MPISTGEKIVQLDENDGKLAITDVQPLLVGGMEGKKFRITAKDANDQNTTLISKEYDINNNDRISSVVKAFQILNRLGYPCPNYVATITENDVTYLLMSDLTNNDEYKIWGWSNVMTLEQQDNLKDMNFTPDDLALLEAQAQAIARNADKDGINILFQNYHVIHDPVTKEKSIVILDVDDKLFSESGREDGWTNSDSAELFIRRIEYAIGIERQPYIYAPEVKKVKASTSPPKNFIFD